MDRDYALIHGDAAFLSDRDTTGAILVVVTIEVMAAAMTEGMRLDTAISRACQEWVAHAACIPAIPAAAFPITEPEGLPSQRKREGPDGLERPAVHEKADISVQPFNLMGRPNVDRRTFAGCRDC